MSEAVRGLVVAHSSLAAGLVAAVQQIAGVGDDALAAAQQRGPRARGADRGRARAPWATRRSCSSPTCRAGAAPSPPGRSPSSGPHTGDHLRGEPARCSSTSSSTATSPSTSWWSAWWRRGAAGSPEPAPRRRPMPIVLLRVDERLIHGQVVVGWGERLHMDRIVVVDDELSASAWEQELYCLGVPPSRGRRCSRAWRRRAAACRGGGRTRGASWSCCATWTRCAAWRPDGRLDAIEVNLGGIHHAPGRERVLPYLFLSGGDQRAPPRGRRAGRALCRARPPGDAPRPARTISIGAAEMLLPEAGLCLLLVPGRLVALDGTSLGQFMVSRPFVAASRRRAGCVGDPMAGASIGRGAGGVPPGGAPRRGGALPGGRARRRWSRAPFRGLRRPARARCSPCCSSRCRGSGSAASRSG